jgi:radical SAM superfamily enzyme YgiQ (UPF0313 family)
MGLPSVKHIQDALWKGTNRKSIILVDFQHSSRSYDAEQTYLFYSEEGAAHYALGLCRIREYLRHFRVPVRIIRFSEYEENKERLLNEIQSADIVCVNALTFTAHTAYAFCVSVKQRFPGKTVVGGAEHYALDFHWILENPKKTGCDICCTYQGELPMLALSLGIDITLLGSVAYNGLHGVNRAVNYPILSERADNPLLRPVPVTSVPRKWMNTAFPEFASTFRYMGKTQTGTGCIYSCTFCTNERFLGHRYHTTLETAKAEIGFFLHTGVRFFFVCDALLNGSPTHLNEFLSFMEEINQNEIQIYWACFFSVQRSAVSMQFSRMAKAGCIMINVGVEDIIGSRKLLKKGNSNQEAVEFCKTASSHLLVRTLLMIGLPSHYHLSRKEIKERFLSYMKANPQAIYRINHFTPLFGTGPYDDYGGMFDKDIRTDLNFLANVDTMHPVLNPEKMYAHLNIPVKKRWVRKCSDWSKLEREIITAYLESEEHLQFLETLKPDTIMYTIACQYRAMSLKNEYSVINYEFQ